MKSHFIFTFVLVLLVSLLAGCNGKNKTPRICGKWVSYNESYVFYEDGTYTVSFKGGSIEGQYMMRKNSDLITLSFRKNDVVRRRNTKYAIEPDGKTLMLEQSQLGMTVLLKRAS